MPERSTEKLSNPIEDSATKIRSSIKSLITEELSGVFPRNQRYMCGYQDKIYLVKEGFGDQHGGFFKSAHHIILTKEGDFISGIVNQRVADYHSCWEFNSAKLNPTEDIDVVRYAPALAFKFFDQIKKELPEEKDMQRVEKFSVALAKQDQVCMEIIKTSRNALISLGENDPSLPTGKDDIGSLTMRELKIYIEALNDDTQ